MAADDVAHVEVGGLRIAYRRAGEGPPLVLLHGAFSDGREWRRQLEGLSDEFAVVAWDAPGFGRSSDPPEGFGARDYAESLAGFIGALGLGRPHLVGLSLGSVLALELYRWHPEIPATLVLASAYAGWAGSLPPDEVEERLQTTLRLLDLPAEEWMPGFIGEIFTEAAPRHLYDEAMEIALDFHPAGMRAVAEAFGRADLRDVLPTIDVPTLLLYGDADARASVAVARELHGRIRGSKLVLIPRVGHQSNMQAPGRFNAEVRAFLRAAGDGR